MNHRPFAAALPLIAAALSLPAQAVVSAVAEGSTDSQPVTAVASSANANASATQAAGALQAGVLANGVGGFTGAHVPANAGGDVGYAVFGLVGAVPVTFQWEFSGQIAWDVDNTAFGGGMGVGIFNKVGQVYIHNVAWNTSFVDGPVAMGDFAGSLVAPIGVPPGGQAGPAGVFDAHVPAGVWNGIGTRSVETIWTLADGWSGGLSYGAFLSLAGNVTASMGVRLLSATVASASQIGAGGAYLLLDDGSHLAINAAVPEPGTWALMAGGLAVIGIVGRVRVPQRRRTA